MARDWNSGALRLNGGSAAIQPDCKQIFRKTPPLLRTYHSKNAKRTSAIIHKSLNSRSRAHLRSNLSRIAPIFVEVGSFRELDAPPQSDSDSSEDYDFEEKETEGTEIASSSESSSYSAQSFVTASASGFSGTNERKELNGMLYSSPLY